MENTPFAGVAQPVEQLICNQQVGGSNPSTSSNATIYGGIPERPKGADCKSVVIDFGGPNPPSPTKKSESICFRIFLSKPQAWHIIAARSAVHIIKGGVAALVSHHAPACILLRLDDIQPYGLMIYRNKLRMIYNASHG